MIPEFGDPIQIPIFSPQHQNQHHSLTISKSSTLKQLKLRVIDLLGYASRIYLYQFPISAFNKLDFIREQATLEQVILTIAKQPIQDVRLAIMYNNTQFRQQPEYRTPQVFNKINKIESFQIVLQILQNNYFVHENFLIPVNNKISFIKSMAERYGHSIYVEYGTARISVEQFGNGLVSTLAPWRDFSNRINISVSGRIANLEDEVGRIRQVFNVQMIGYQKFFIVELGEEGLHPVYYVINRDYSLKTILKTFQLIKSRTFEFKSTKTNQLLAFSDKCPPQLKILCLQTKPEEFFPVKILPIQNCQLLSSKHSASSPFLIITLIERSSILHRLIYSLSHTKIIKHSTTILPCVQTDMLDQDNFYTYTDKFGETKLIGYSINIHGITIKYFNGSGELQMINMQKWHEGQIEFKVNDLFCIKPKFIKKSGERQISSEYIKIFYMHRPSEFIFIDKKTTDGFFPARKGFNCCSDGSGVFGIWQKWKAVLSIYQYPQEKTILVTPISQIKVQKPNLTDVFFGWESNQKETRIIGINFGNTLLELYSMRGQSIAQILCLSGMSNFFFLGEALLSCTQTQIYEYQFDTSEWKQSHHPLNNFLVDVQTKEMIMPINELQLKKLDGFNFYKREINVDR